MAIEIPYDHPESLNAGDTLKFKKALDDYSASDGWSLTYIIRGNGANMKQSYSNTNSTGDYEFNVSADNTALWTAGTYKFVGKVEKDGEVTTVDEGEFKVLADIEAGSGALDTRTLAKKTLDAIDATLNGTASSAEQTFTIGSKTITRYTPSELIELRKYYGAIVLREDQERNNKYGRKSGRRIQFTFKA